MGKIIQRLLFVLAISSLILTFFVSPAQAGEAGRNCQPFYSSGDPNSPWNFEVCVKLVHDPTTHTWWSTGKITSRTKGIKLYLNDIQIQINGVTWNIEKQSKEPHSTFITGESEHVRCFGAVNLKGTALGVVVWPNGVTSHLASVQTKPTIVRGTC